MRWTSVIYGGFRNRHKWKRKDAKKKLPRRAEERNCGKKAGERVMDEGIEKIMRIKQEKITYYNSIYVDRQASTIDVDDIIPVLEVDRRSSSPVR
jgi:hypothetical protein